VVVQRAQWWKRNKFFAIGIWHIHNIIEGIGCGKEKLAIDFEEKRTIVVERGIANERKVLRTRAR